MADDAVRKPVWGQTRGLRAGHVRPDHAVAWGSNGAEHSRRRNRAEGSGAKLFSDRRPVDPAQRNSWQLRRSSPQLFGEGNHLIGFGDIGANVLRESRSELIGIPGYERGRNIFPGFLKRSPAGVSRGSQIHQVLKIVLPHFELLLPFHDVAVTADGVVKIE